MNLKNLQTLNAGEGLGKWENFTTTMDNGIEIPYKTVKATI